MRKILAAGILFIALALGIVSYQTAQANEPVCGQWRPANCPFNGPNTPVFQPCGTSELWVVDPAYSSYYQAGQFARLFWPRVSHDEGFACDGQAAGWLFAFDAIDVISSCAACQPVQNTPPSGYAWCVGEGQRCSFGGVKDVAYGANGQFNYRYGVTGGIDCNNNVFGDPISNVAKACYTKESSQPTAVPPTPTTVPQIDNARFVADVTIPDGVTFAPNAKFTKTWRVQNNGNLTWSTGYQLTFVSGERMGSPATVNLSRAMKPGEQVDLSVQLQAPAKPGTYRGTYQLRNAQGTFFGSKLTVVIKVPAPTATRTPAAKRSPTVTPTPTAQAFTVTWMEVAPQVPVQNQTAVVQVFLDNAGPRDTKYLTDFDGEVILRNSAGQVVERQAFDHDHNASFLPDAEAMKKDLFSKKWILTVRQVRFKQWADTATLEVWLRPLGTRSGMNSVKASMRLAIKADPDALTRCVSFVSKKLVAFDLPIGDVKWVLVGTGAATRIGTCTTRECVALEIAQLAVKLGKAEAMQLLSLALRVVNLQNMTGAADCYNLAQ